MECMQVYLCGIQYYTLYFYTFKHLLLNPFFFPVSCLKIFSTIYSPQHCFSHLSPARFNFLNFSISQFTVFLFFFFCFGSWNFFIVVFLMLIVIFLLFLHQDKDSRICLTVSLSSALHLLFHFPLLYRHLLPHQPYTAVQATTIALVSGKHVSSGYKCQI